MKHKKPDPKQFDCSKYKKMIESLSENMSELKFEHISEIVVPDILENYEGFEKTIKGPNYRGAPFDFLSFKNGQPYIVEYKGSLKSFNSPDETQKRRLKEILSTDSLKNLHVALLQVKLSKSQYRIFYDEEMSHLFNGKNAPLEPIVDWLKKHIEKA